MICGAILTLGQLGIVLALIFDLDDIVNQIATYKHNKNPNWNKYGLAGGWCVCLIWVEQLDS